jgi:hypothetical protein
LRCGDELAAMFVFYDRDRRPVGIVHMDSECGQWGLVPAPRDAWEGLALVTDNEHRVLRQICEDLDLASCSGESGLQAHKDDNGHPRPATQDEMAADARALLPLLLHAWPDIDGNKPLSSASSVQRAELCAWYVQSARMAEILYTGNYLPEVRAGRFQDEDTRKTIRLTSYAECVDEFPRCDGAIEDARACITRHLETFWNPGETCSLDCAWGLSTAPMPAP